MSRILFIASLHHPQQLQQAHAAAQQSQTDLPLFPPSDALHFWEKVLRKQGYSLAVFWRNLSGFGQSDIRSLKAPKYTNHLTPRRIAQAIGHRLPYTLNPDLQRRNANLLNEVRRFQPDVVWMVGGNTVIHADTLARIKQETGCKIIYSTGVSPIVFSQPIERDAAPLYDLVITNDYYHGIQWRELGAKDMICLPVVAMDPDFHYPRELSAEEQAQFACDVGFVGTLLPPNLYSERVAALEALQDFDLGIWSVHEIPPSLTPFLHGSALGDTMLRVLSGAKMTLNVHGNFMRYGGNMRLFEAAGVGTFQLVDDRPGVHEWFKDGEHLVIFHDAHDLREKAAYYLAHPEERAQIAAAARRHVLEHHTYDQRLKVLEQYFPLSR